MKQTDENDNNVGSVIINKKSKYYKPIKYGIAFFILYNAIYVILAITSIITNKEAIANLNLIYVILNIAFILFFLVIYSLYKKK